jgi:hypothetical protein
MCSAYAGALVCDDEPLALASVNALLAIPEENCVVYVYA